MSDQSSPSADGVTVFRILENIGPGKRAGSESTLERRRQSWTNAEDISESERTFSPQVQSLYYRN